ncbi:MAG: hypothetical protein HYY06_08725 [Deltaproteobacteria bacterium]|nr:hypothetical protein [Deltaproteobacteria bacterium]
MVRKQLYIDERQERALKKKARSLGISEAELVRQALDRVLEAPSRPRSGRETALAAFLERADAIAREHRLPGRFRREELYEEREARLVRR